MWDFPMGRSLNDIRSEFNCHSFNKSLGPSLPCVTKGSQVRGVLNIESFACFHLIDCWFMPMDK